MDYFLPDPSRKMTSPAAGCSAEESREQDIYRSPFPPGSHLHEALPLLCQPLSFPADRISQLGTDNSLVVCTRARSPSS